MLLWREFLSQFFRPMRGIVDVGTLRGSSVLCLGCGAVGSLAVDHLSRSGIGKMTLWDYDRTEVANLARTSYLTTDLGRPKSMALAEHVKHVNPLAQVVAIEGDLLRTPEELIANLASRHDVALVAADSFKVHARLNLLLYHSIETVFTYVLVSGDRGEIVRTAPGEPGCVRCLTNYEERMGARVASDFQALGIDMLRVALDAATVILGILLGGRKGGEIFEDYVSPESHLLLTFTRRRGALAGALPEELAGGTVRVDTRRSWRDCPVCGPNRAP